MRWMVEDYGELADLIGAGNAHASDETARDPGLLIGRMRRALQINQRELALRSGVARSVLSKLELGDDVQLSTIRRVLAALDCGYVLLPTSRALLEPLREKQRERQKRDEEWAKYLRRA